MIIQKIFLTLVVCLIKILFVKCDTGDFEILTYTNFSTLTEGSPRAWLIDFYQTWCGRCLKFLPKYQELAKDVKNWNDLIRVGAIDCNDEHNIEICLDFSVSKVPHLVYLHENFHKAEDKVGVPFKLTKLTTAKNLRQNLINIIIDEQKVGRGKLYPNLNIFDGHNNELIPNNDKNHVFLIINFIGEEVIGPEVALDLHNLTDVSVRYSTTPVQLEDLPKLVHITKKNSLGEIPATKTREGFVQAIRSFHQQNVVLKN